MKKRREIKGLLDNMRFPRDPAGVCVALVRRCGLFCLPERAGSGAVAHV